MKRLFGIVVFMLSDIVQANSVVVANLFDDPVAVEWGGLETRPYPSFYPTGGD